MKLEEFLQDKNIKEEAEDLSHPIEKIKIYEDYVMLYLKEEKIQVSVDSYFENKIKGSKGLSDELYHKLKDEEIVFKAYRSALRKLSYKDHTVKQISDHLKGKGLNASQISKLIDKLKGYGLLDDEKYCVSRIAYLKDARLSAKQITYKLKKEGISEQLITDHLKTDPETELQNASDLVKKYQKTIRNKSSAAKRKAIMERLLALGYSHETVTAAVQNGDTESENELELLRKEYEKSLLKYGKKYEGRQLDEHLTARLLQKGFSYSDIKTVMEEGHGKES
ncbi:MAG: RecX family transcriptional regulator [Erysipelotrichaceae bacterium]|nr:RecX family transcriptional regulator [Erysipelotrichaceae bacterium]